MHRNEPLKTQPNTQIKMKQPQHSLAPHLDSFTKSTPSLSPPKPHQNVLKTPASSLSLRCACLGMSRALVAQEKILCGWEESAGLLGTEQGGSSHHRSDVGLLSLTSIHLSIHPYFYSVCSFRVRSNIT